MQDLKKISFIIFCSIIIAVGILGLTTPLLTVLFSVFAMRHIKIKNSKAASIIIFLILVSSILTGFWFFVGEVRRVLPTVAENAILALNSEAQSRGFNLPFSDMQGAKEMVGSTIKHSIPEVAHLGHVAIFQFVYLVIGIVVAVSLFLNSKLDLGHGSYAIEHNLYSKLCNQISDRFSTFYASFDRVIGAQLVISGINTFFTAIYVISAGLPYSKVVIIITFLCGLLPIIGNLISNTIIFCIAATVSINQAISALVFLIVLHKFEYFLNSKIIGGRIKNPMWLTLLGLIVGEKLMGIPGMILAPVVLNYLKLEGSQIEVKNTNVD